MTATLSIGLDVGGTFTDLFMVDDLSGETFRHKLSSTPEDPYEAPVRGIREIIGKRGPQAGGRAFRRPRHHRRDERPA